MCKKKNLFQAIAEVRELFKGEEVIKTFPRKGHRWQLTVVCSASKAGSEQSASSDYSKTKVREAWPLSKKASLILIGLLVILASILAGSWWQNKPLQENLYVNTVLVLPVRNEIEGSDHQWGLLWLVGSACWANSSSRTFEDAFNRICFIVCGSFES